MQPGISATLRVEFHHTAQLAAILCGKTSRVDAEGREIVGPYLRAKDQHSETRMSFHQGCDVTVLAASEQVALPMTGNSAVFNLGRPFPDRDGIDDLTARLSRS